MFTGIIERTGEVLQSGHGRIVVQPAGDPGDWRIGESVAINGCCLTVVSIGAGLTFDLSPETLQRTTLGSLERGDTVNIERCMLVGSRFEGHIVQGHVEAAGEVVSIESQGNATVFRFRAPESYAKYLIDKGSIAVDGISLTVVAPEGPTFEAWIIPHTLKQTTLQRRKPGDRVNLEFDVLAKYVERLCAPT